MRLLAVTKNRQGEANYLTLEAAFAFPSCPGAHLARVSCLRATNRIERRTPGSVGTQPGRAERCNDPARSATCAFEHVKFYQRSKAIRRQARGPSRSVFATATPAHPWRHAQFSCRQRRRD